MGNISGRVSSSIHKSHLNVDKKVYMDFIGLWEGINKIEIKTYHIQGGIYLWAAADNPH